MTVINPVYDYAAKTKAYYASVKTEILEHMDALFLMQDIKNCDDYMLTLVKFNAAVYKVRMIKDAIINEGLTTAEWKARFDYETTRDCLQCIPIDFDAILTTFQISL